MDVIKVKDLTEFSKKQQIKIDTNLRMYGICYLEKVEGSVIMDIVVRDPKNITVITDRDWKYWYNFSKLKRTLDRQCRINKDSILIEKIKLTWFQKLMLKIARLI